MRTKGSLPRYHLASPHRAVWRISCPGGLAHQPIRASL